MTDQHRSPGVSAGVPASDGVWAALADPTRRAVVGHLSERGPLTATQLAAWFPISRQMVVKHLASLGDAGLVAGERCGREVRYRLIEEPLAEVGEWVLRVGSSWDRRLEALGRLAAERPHE
jgi:DNA-binding transcriptional ArsR family regulator